MGGSGSVLQSDSLSSSTILTDIVISFYQSIDQVATIEQNVIVNCNKNTKAKNGQVCMDCLQSQARQLKTTKASGASAEDFGYSQKEIRKKCSASCECKVDDVDMLSKVTLDVSAQQKTFSVADMETLIEKTLALQAKQKNVGLTFNNTAKQKTEVATAVLNYVRSDSVKTIIFNLSGSQDLNLIGPGKVGGVSMKKLTDSISKALQGSSQYNSVIQKVSAQVMGAMYQVTLDGLQTTIKILLQVMLIGVIILLFFFIGKALLDVLALYVS